MSGCPGGARKCRLPGFLIPNLAGESFPASRGRQAKLSSSQENRGHWPQALPEPSKCSLAKSLCQVCTPEGLKHLAPSCEGSVAPATVSLGGQSGKNLERKDSRVYIEGSLIVGREALILPSALGGAHWVCAVRGEIKTRVKCSGGTVGDLD